MIRLATILPIAYINKIDRSYDSQICMLLAHQALKSAKYLKIYKKRQKEGGYLILDNSAYEFGKAISNDLLFNVIKVAQPDEFVLPDAICDFKTTIKLTSNFLEKYNNEGKIKLMAVPQGKTIDEYIECYKYFSTNTLIDTIGLASKSTELLPRINDYISGRHYVLETLIAKGLICKKPHHLLGLGDSGHHELKVLKQYTFIRSCDSSAAYIHAKNGLVFNDKSYTKISEKIDFGDSYDENVNYRLNINISVLYNYAN